MKQFPCCWISLNFYSLCPWLEMPFRSTGTNAPAIPCHSPYWPETCLVLKRKCIDLYNTSCEQKPKLGKFSLFLRSSTFHFLWLQRKVADKCNFISCQKLATSGFVLFPIWFTEKIQITKWLIRAQWYEPYRASLRTIQRCIQNPGECFISITLSLFKILTLCSSWIFLTLIFF